jgi:hypothetical protein
MGCSLSKVTARPGDAACCLDALHYSLYPIFMHSQTLYKCTGGHAPLGCITMLDNRSPLSTFSTMGRMPRSKAHADQ